MIRRPHTMKSLSLFVVSILIFSGFLGCLDDSGKSEDKISQITDNKPIATDLPAVEELINYIKANPTIMVDHPIQTYQDTG